MNKNEKYMFVLCGFPASGKSTIAKKINAIIPCNILSMDAYRNPLEDGGLSQEDNGKVFAIFRNAIEKSVKRNQNIIVDALNLKAQNRKYYMKLTKDKEYKHICIFIDCDIETCMKNNRNKDRTHIVPNSYYEKIKNRGSKPILDEGWDEIYIIKIDYDTNNITIVENKKGKS